MKHWKKQRSMAAISLVCAVAVTISLVPPLSVAASVTAKTTDYLNLREGAGANKKVILTLSKGITVTVLDNSNATWTKVQTTSGKQGYCSKQYLSVSSTGNSTSPSSSVSSGVAVTTEYLNLRDGASTTNKIIVTLSKGATVKVLDNSNASWTKVQTSDGRTGYCSKQFLKITAATTPSTTPAATPVTTTTPVSTSSTVALTTDYINMREGAGTNYKVTTTISKGITLKVLDNSNAKWAKVQASNGKTGYCSKDYLKITTPSATPTTPATKPPTTPASTPTTTTPLAVVAVAATTTDTLNVRSGAGTSFGIVSTLANGTTVTVLDNSNASWAKIKTSAGKTGYCSKEFLKITTSTGATTPPATTVPPEGTGTNTNPATTHTITGASVTADVLRMRATASATGTIVTNLPQGTSLKVLDASNTAWTKVQTSSGQTGYVSTEYIQIHYSDDTSNASSLSLSTSLQTVPIGKTLYIKATISPSTTSVNWESSNPAVATVSNGYVNAVSNGSAVITASSGSYKATCTVNVTDAEPVKTAYSSPNIVSTGAVVTLTAVTDTTRDGVQFVVTMPNGSTKTLAADHFTAETMLNTNTKKWTATTTFDTAGTYAFTAFSSLNGSMSATGYTTNAYVSAQQNFTTTTNESRRISDQMIALIANWEGYRSTVYADMLTANQVPTIGYGCTFGANAIFYNDMTQTEAWSMLVNKINNSSYTSELNEMIQNYNFLMNQNQADCLISFAYNVGAGYFNSSSEMDFRTIMRNAVVPPSISGDASLAATVTKDTIVRSAPSITGSQVCTVASGTAITATDSNFTNIRDGWYKVRLADNSEGWVNSGYVRLANSDSLVHDLNYTNAYAIGTEMLRWSQASGKFYTGLFYRRMGEVNVYNYGDYNAVRSNQYNYAYPSGAAGLD